MRFTETKEDKTIQSVFYLSKRRHNNTKIMCFTKKRRQNNTKCVLIKQKKTEQYKVCFTETKEDKTIQGVFY